MRLLYKILGVVVLLVAAVVLGLGLALSHNDPCGAAPVLSSNAKLMKAIVHRCYGPPEVLKYENLEKPTPENDQVLIRVHAASLNPLDWHFMRGTPYPFRLAIGLGKPKEPRLGVDFAGTVEAVGKDVTRFKPGDEVFGGNEGAFAEYVAVRESEAVVPKPSALSFEQAASLPIAGITALQALRDKGKVQPGQKVLINGASGGVGTFAVQIAKIYGAEVTGVCSTKNAELVRSLGADHVVDYTREDFTKGTAHYDLILDTVGNHSLLEYRRVLNPKGTVLIIGGPKGNWLGPMQGWMMAVILSPFVSQKLLPFMADMNSADLAALAALMQSGKLKAVIDRRYTLSELPSAMEYLEAGHARGKVVIEVGDNTKT